MNQICDTELTWINLILHECIMRSLFNLPFPFFCLIPTIHPSPCLQHVLCDEKQFVFLVSFVFLGEVYICIYWVNSVVPNAFLSSATLPCKPHPLGLEVLLTFWIFICQVPVCITTSTRYSFREVSTFYSCSCNLKYL